jgi:hypothetical protein
VEEGVLDAFDRTKTFDCIPPRNGWIHGKDEPERRELYPLVRGLLLREVGFLDRTC